MDSKNNLEERIRKANDLKVSLESKINDLINHLEKELKS